jgi:hypothetical protein
LGFTFGNKFPITIKAIPTRDNDSIGTLKLTPKTNKNSIAEMKRETTGQIQKTMFIALKCWFLFFLSKQVKKEHSQCVARRKAGIAKTAKALCA